MFGRATIRLGIGPHSSYVCFYYVMRAFDMLLIKGNLLTYLLKCNCYTIFLTFLEVIRFAHL